MKKVTKEQRNQVLDEIISDLKKIIREEGYYGVGEVEHIMWYLKDLRQNGRQRGKK